MKEVRKLFSLTMFSIKSWFLLTSLLTTWAHENNEVMICMHDAPCTCDDNTNVIDCSNANLTTIKVSLQNGPAGYTRVISFENCLLTELLRVEIYLYLVPDHVENLSFAKNRISYIEKRAFDKHVSLRRVILKENLLDTIDPDWFIGTKLEMLDLSLNKISSIADNAFARLTILKVLHLDHNQLKNIGDASFVGLSMLRKLNINNNPLTDVQGREFSALSRLETISMKYAAMENFPVFPSSMKMLKRIGFNGNLIESVHAYQFANVPTVDEIHLNFMPKLKTVEKCAFCKLTRLRRLFISNNPNFGSIDENAFEPEFGITNLVDVLDFSNNNLTRLSPRLIQWKSAGAVYLAGNKWNCSCEVDWMTDNNVTLMDVPKCFYPEALRNQSIKQLGAEVFNKCHQKQMYAISKWIVPMATVILVLVAAVVLCSIWHGRKADGRIDIPIKNNIENAATIKHYAYKNVPIEPVKINETIAEHDSLGVKFRTPTHGTTTGKREFV